MANLEKGTIVSVHVCDECCYAQKVRPKKPDCIHKSYLCGVCGHFGIGSKRDCIIGNWNIKKIV